MAQQFASSGDDQRLRVVFVNTHLSVGGAETLLCSLIRRMDRERFTPELCCLKHLGPLGEQLAQEVFAEHGLLRHKADVGVIGRLAQRWRKRGVAAVVTVGTGGDKMFWGRLAAWRAGVPVVLSALHSTGLPDRVEPTNRLLARWTDGFIAVAEAHARYITAAEGCPADKVFVVPNGVDVERFAPRAPRPGLRGELGLGAVAPVASIVAALRPEKQHELFLRAAAGVLSRVPAARFLIIGDGPRRAELEQLAAELRLGDAVQFLGVRSDVADLLSITDVVCLTSKMEANPVSLLEAMACEKPIVATAVGSIPEMVLDGECGFLVPPGDVETLAARMSDLMSDPARAAALGRRGRQEVISRASLDSMVSGYQDLIERIYRQKRGGLPHGRRSVAAVESPAHDRLELSSRR
ncbi:MAG: glycosyltransferase [Pirellulales bacterium]|nr:glycosyltransferase [Pirellulales bacterium]